jgi:hypothetical protein
MAFKDENCTCTEYCKCKYDPCACDKMSVDPHCQGCLEHLTPEQEARWREEKDEEVTYVWSNPILS